MSDFGTLPDGSKVRRLTLSAGELTVRVLTLGAILNDVRLGDGPGLTLGSDRLEPYLGPMAFFGAVVGPVANRIAGATVDIAGRTYPLIANEKGRTTLHGGPKGTHGRVWHVEAEAADRVTLTLDLPDDAEGYPGNRRLAATFRVLAPATLELALSATTDAPTLVNLANHSYWNLGPADLAGHRLQVAADRYTPVDADLIPTGVAPVAGTGFDLRAGAPVGEGAATALDHNFCLADARGPLRFAARLTGPTGLAMTIETTEPGLQVYDARRQPPTGPGHDGRSYGAYAGVALEAQCWPDAPHQASFPAVTLAPGEVYRQVTRWSFARP
jgi:aldose 1-epimerase